MDDSSGAPPDYEGRIALDPTLLDVGRLEAALETGVFQLSNSQVHQCHELAFFTFFSLFILLH